MFKIATATFMKSASRVLLRLRTSRCTPDSCLRLSHTCSSAEGSSRNHFFVFRHPSPSKSESLLSSAQPMCQLCNPTPFLNSLSPLLPPTTGSRQEPPDVCRARGGGDPQGADQRAGGEEQPAGEGELPAEEPGQPRAAGEVPVSHPHGRAAGQPQLPGRAATAAEPSSLRRLCCVSGSALGRAEPLPLDKSGPPTLNQKLCDVANRRVPFRRKAKRRGCKMIDGTQMNCWDSDKHNIELVML